MKDFKDLNEHEMAELEEAALKSALNMGAARDMFHPNYGWIVKDGEITEAGMKFYENEMKED